MMAHEEVEEVEAESQAEDIDEICRWHGMEYDEWIAELIAEARKTQPTITLADLLLESCWAMWNEWYGPAEASQNILGRLVCEHVSLEPDCIAAKIRALKPGKVVRLYGEGFIVEVDNRQDLYGKYPYQVDRHAHPRVESWEKLEKQTLCKDVGEAIATVIEDLKGKPRD